VSAARHGRGGTAPQSWRRRFLERKKGRKGKRGEIGEDGEGGGKKEAILNIDQSLVWEQLADEFDAVTDFDMHVSVADESEEGVDNEEDARIGEMERLLTVGQEMSAEQLERALSGVERMHTLSSMSCVFGTLGTTDKKNYSPLPTQKKK
jgi:hypothetical protein